MLRNLGDLAVLDRNVHHGVDVIFGIDDMSFVKQEIVGRKCGLGEDTRSCK